MRHHPKIGRAFLHNENGSAGGWSLFVLLCCIVAAAIAIDGTNGFRAKEHLQVTADIAAHAGLVELAKGGTDEDIRDAVADIVELNMPKTAFGTVLGSSADYVDIGRYENGRIVTGSSDPENAVSVELHFSTAFGNPIKTFLLGLAGRNVWDIAASSAAVMDASEGCNGNDGIYALGEIKMTSTSEIGAGFCIYSKDVVEMSNHNTFLPGAKVGMPDLDDCSHCTDAHNTGVEDAKFEANLQLEDVEDHVQTVIDALLGNSYDTEPRDEFLKGAYLDTDITPLVDLGFAPLMISKGTVLSIAAADFEEMEFVPSGLIYAVYCSGPLSSADAISATEDTEGGKGKGKKSEGGPSKSVKSLSLETGSGAEVADVAIVTDCQLDFGSTATISNSIIATTSTSNQSVSASSKARIGSGSLVCPSEEKVVIMSMGDLSVPAALETNNVDFYIAGDAHLASGTSTQATKLGTSFYVGGTMHISAQGNWYACGDEADSLTPTIEAIRQVLLASD